MTIKKIGIIGGSGFLGSSLSTLLDDSNVKYCSFDIDSSNNNEKKKFLDIEDQESLSQLNDINTLINLAAIHRDDVRPISRYDDVNVDGAKNICSAAREHNITKIIFTSSVAIYGFAPANTDESGKPNYFNDYGRTKYLAEKIYKDWYSEDKKNRTLVIIRPTVIFGEGNRGNVYNLLRQIASKRFAMIGNGKNKKSMAYVGNVAAFIKYTLDYDSGLHIYNYVDKPDFDMNKLVSLTRQTLFKKKNVGMRVPIFFGLIIGLIADFISKISGKNLPISSIRVRKFSATTQFETSIKTTDFEAPYELDDALVKTIKYEFLEDNSNKKTFDTE